MQYDPWQLGDGTFVTHLINMDDAYNRWRESTRGNTRPVTSQKYKVHAALVEKALRKAPEK